MGITYKGVLWNRQKRLYDSIAGVGLLVYLLIFGVLSFLLNPHITIDTVLIRGFGTSALLLLHVVLSIGPLSRLDPRFLPLLYNRRHLGVLTFLAGLAHGTIAFFQFHMLGEVNPLVSILTTNSRYESLSQFPFQPLGLLALSILFLMAATSHDFWLANLTAPIWKALHMLVYVAYALVVTHVTLGVLQDERSAVFTFLVAAGLVWISGLHILAAFCESARDRVASSPDSEGYVRICSVEEIPEKCAATRLVAGERVAVFKYDGKVSAVSSVCQHQNGPLGEGRIIDGCITCPWHGYQYDRGSGRSPAPFQEKIPTFNLKVIGRDVYVHETPNPPGTWVEPAEIARKASAGDEGIL